MRKNIFKIGLLLGALVMIALGVSLLFPSRPQPDPKSFPNPNGYDTLVQAGRLLPKGVSGFEKLDQLNLGFLVQDSSNALQLARVALTQESQVPLEFTSTYFSTHTSDLAEFKKLAQAFAAESRLAEMENRLPEAVQSCLDGIHAGIKSTRGGLLIHEMVGLAMESISTANLRKLVSRLNAESSRHAATTLETIDSERPAFQDIMDREREWMRRSPASFREKLAAFLNSKSTKAIAAKTEKRVSEHHMENRRLMIELAARAYALEKGAPPKTTADLVPDYLKAIPKDPVTGTNMINLP